jgi:hypothetical protein
MARIWFAMFGSVLLERIKKKFYFIFTKTKILCAVCVKVEQKQFLVAMN